MIKRTIDILVSLSAIIILMPLLLCIGILIQLDSQGPIVFVQRRVGIKDTEFLMYKFRTMFIGTPEVATDQLNDSQRYITKVGYHLRKYSLDELPQLINILFGDMSIVGPRPALYNQSELRAMRNKLGISSLRPGLTGWAQINGRDEIALEEKVALDDQYRHRQNFYFDLKIICATFFSVFSGSGVKVKTFSQE